jgi:hypothetical protein
MKLFLRKINLLNILLLVDTFILVNYNMVPLVHMGVCFAPPMRKKTPVHQDEKAAGSTVPIMYGYLDGMYRYS